VLPCSSNMKNEPLDSRSQHPVPRCHTLGAMIASVSDGGSAPGWSTPKWISCSTVLAALVASRTDCDGSVARQIPPPSASASPSESRSGRDTDCRGVAVASSRRPSTTKEPREKAQRSLSSNPPVGATGPRRRARETTKRGTVWRAGGGGGDDTAHAVALDNASIERSRSAADGEATQELAVVRCGPEGLLRSGPFNCHNGPAGSCSEATVARTCAFSEAEVAD